MLDSINLYNSSALNGKITCFTCMRDAILSGIFISCIFVQLLQLQSSRLRLNFACVLVQEVPERQEAMETCVNKTLLYLQGAITASGMLCWPLEYHVNCHYRKTIAFQLCSFLNHHQRLAWSGL